jgi:hypothetical protein
LLSSQSNNAEIVVENNLYTVNIFRYKCQNADDEACEYFPWDDLAEVSGVICETVLLDV